MSDIEEGDNCPVKDCSGRMLFGEVEGCYCPIITPCGACLSQMLECGECGKEEQWVLFKVAVTCDTDIEFVYGDTEYLCIDNG